MDHRHLRLQEAAEIDRPWTIATEGRVNGITVEPFIQTSIILEGEAQPLLIGQIDTKECVALGLRMIQASIEAERDAGLIRYLRSQSMPDQVIAELLNGMRQYREQHDILLGDVAAKEPDHKEPEPGAE